MSKDDSFYVLVGVNLFVEYKIYGGKILGYLGNGSFFGFEFFFSFFLYIFFCISIMILDGILARKKYYKIKQTQLFLLFFVLLRKVVEKFYQEFLYGSINCRRNFFVNIKRYFLYFFKFKSAIVLSEFFVYRLQCEFNMEDFEKFTSNKGQRGRKYYRQFSVDIQRIGFDLGNDSDSVTDNIFQNGGNSENVLF